MTTTREYQVMRRFTALANIGSDAFVVSDLMQLIIGDLLGEGLTRKVFQFKPDIDNLVIKYGNVRENQIEYSIYHNACQKDSSIVNWLAACYFISPCGNFLIQQRTRAMLAGESLPPHLPAIFDDIKFENFGWIGQRLVCHDYSSLHRVIELGTALVETKLNK